MQGRFKRLPQGVLYLGGEITEQLKLGLVARSLANMLLKFVRARVPGGALHYSFGDKDGTGQIAHITMPLWSAADRLVITPEGGVPPQLGTHLPESEASRLARRASSEPGASGVMA